MRTFTPSSMEVIFQNERSTSWGQAFPGPVRREPPARSDPCTGRRLSRTCDGRPRSRRHRPRRGRPRGRGELACDSTDGAQLDLLHHGTIGTEGLIGWRRHQNHRDLLTTTKTQRIVQRPQRASRQDRLRQGMMITFQALPRLLFNLLGRKDRVVGRPTMIVPAGVPALSLRGQVDPERARNSAW